MYFIKHCGRHIFCHPFFRPIFIFKFLFSNFQVHYKLMNVEDAMREMVHESMNVFVGEVVKQVAL